MDEHIEALRRAWARQTEAFDAHMADMIVRWQLRKISQSKDAQPSKDRWLATLVEHKRA